MSVAELLRTFPMKMSARYLNSAPMLYVYSSSLLSTMISLNCAPS